MPGRLEGRVAVITGGASGMGRASVLRFLDEGASVVVGDLNVDAGRDLTESAVSHSGRLRFQRADVSIEEDVESLVSMAVETFGSLDVMFNNAGIGGAFGPITEIDVEHWDSTFDILTRSVFLGTKHAARVMIPNGGGSIINTASIAGLIGGTGPQAYSAAKAAVVNLTMTTAVELAEYWIRVNAICPGIIFTPLATGGDEASLQSAAEDLQPWPGRGMPEDIAGPALWLASDDARFVTGEAIRVDGGLYAAGTRMAKRIDPRGSTRRYTGIAFGSTGQAPTARKLEPTRSK